MGRACSMHRRKHAYKILVEKHEETTQQTKA
jgi:hypothetical protein